MGAQDDTIRYYPMTLGVLSVIGFIVAFEADAADYLAIGSVDMLAVFILSVLCLSVMTLAERSGRHTHARLVTGVTAGYLAAVCASALWIGPTIRGLGRTDWTVAVVSATIILTSLVSWQVSKIWMRSHGAVARKIYAIARNGYWAAIPVLALWAVVSVVSLAFAWS